MDRMKMAGRTKRKQSGISESDKRTLYDLTTPRWDQYYKRIRRSIRFPRYYKKALNW